MNETYSIINTLRNGDEEYIKSFIESTRLYALNCARNQINDNKKAIDIVKSSYEELIFGNEIYNENDSIIDILRNTINKHISNTEIDLKNINEEVIDKYNLESIDINRYKEYYDNPKVENEINEIINSLDNIEKRVLIDSYYSGKDLDAIAIKYKTNKNTIQYYLNKANDKINKIDFEKVALVYSVISLGLSIASLDFVGIGMSAAKDKFKEKVLHDESDNKDLKSFVKNTLKEYVEDWFLERLRSLVATTTVGAVARSFFSQIKAFFTGIINAIKSLLVKKAVVVATATCLSVGGGYVAYRESIRNKALQYMQDTFNTDMFNSNKTVTAGDMRKAIDVCYGLDRDFAYDEGMSDDTILDDFFLFWPLVKHYWPEVENNWDAIKWENYPDSEWYPGIIASDQFINENKLNTGYNSKAKGINMKDFAILIMNCDKFYKGIDK